MEWMNTILYTFAAVLWVLCMLFALGIVIQLVAAVIDWAKDFGLKYPKRSDKR